MPASMTQFFQPSPSSSFSDPYFSVMWVKLDKIGRNPSIPMKFALGILQLGAGFLVTLIGLKFADDQALVPLLTLVFLYMLHTTGELFLSPIGLSMVTKLSPKNMAGTAMGGWFLKFCNRQLCWRHHRLLTGATGIPGKPYGCRRPRQIHRCILNDRSGIGRFAVLITLFNKPSEQAHARGALTAHCNARPSGFITFQKSAVRRFSFAILQKFYAMPFRVFTSRLSCFLVR